MHLPARCGALQSEVSQRLPFLRYTCIKNRNVPSQFSSCSGCSINSQLSGCGLSPPREHGHIKVETGVSWSRNLCLCLPAIEQGTRRWRVQVIAFSCGREDDFYQHHQ
jgi:hypothetical protein